MHPAIAAAFTHISYEDVDLERLEAERRTERKRAARRADSRGRLHPGWERHRDRSRRRARRTCMRGPGQRLEPGEPLMPSSVFYVGSLAKQFVAACVALARRRRRARISTTPVGSIVEDLPAWARRDTRSPARASHERASATATTAFTAGLPVTGVPERGNEDRVGRGSARSQRSRRAGHRVRATRTAATPAREVVVRESFGRPRSRRSRTTGCSSRSA